MQLKKTFIEVIKKCTLVGGIFEEQNQLKTEMNFFIYIDFNFLNIICTNFAWTRNSNLIKR